MRIVSLSPLATEIVLALDRGARLVAVDAASARAPGLRPGLPVAEAASAGTFSPDLLLVPADQAAAARRAAPGAETLEVAPHNFDDAWDLYRSIGAALGREAEAHRYVLEVSRPLAELGATSFGKRRPRIVAVLALEPLEIAGGHSYLTDVIELAGGENVSHGTEETRLAWSPEEIARKQPELALLVSAHEPGPAEIGFARALLGPGPRIEPLVFDAESFWIDDALPTVERVSVWLDALRASRPE